MSNVRQLTRDKLAAVFKTPETIRAFEALVLDVGINLPEAVQAAAAAADAALVEAADLDARVDALEAAPSGGGHVIEDEGIALPQQAALNFVGAGVTVTDAGGKTVVTIPGGGGGGGNSYFPSGF